MHSYFAFFQIIEELILSMVNQNIQWMHGIHAFAVQLRIKHRWKNDTTRRDGADARVMRAWYQWYEDGPTLNWFYLISLSFFSNFEGPKNVFPKYFLNFW